MRFLIIALMLLPVAVRCQNVFSGVVYDKQTGKALPDASVFLPELHKGIYTSSEGKFSFRSIGARKFLIEVSHVGYQSSFRNVILPGDSTLNISLQPSLISVQEVVITGKQMQSPEETSFNVVQMNRTKIEESASLNLSDAISKLPGISQLTTGPGISKPVIRGLFGNRIQVNLNGLRFDNQQWQDEHGLGLSDIGVDRVEIIRGPASVLYGSDAIGGVINIIDEKPAAVNNVLQDLNLKFYSNTYGVSANYGYSKSTEDRWKKLRAGVDSHADYNDGNNDRVLNSRFASYNFKMSWGRHNANRIHVWNVMASHSMFGFVFDSLSRKREDARMSRTFDGPHHAVSFAQVSTENTYFREDKKIKLNAGFISNLRLEDEGGGGISLSMLLNTVNGLAQVTRNISQSAEWTYGGSVLLQSNTNFGGRIIIPDAVNTEASLFTFYHHRFAKWLLEGGVRYDNRYVETLATHNLNVIGNDSPTEEIVPFRKLYHAYNVSVGSEYFLSDDFSLKGNVSTGYRPGNLAELSSNGLHEGTLRWEIGIPTAKIEQNLTLEGSLNYSSALFRSSVSFYRNQFRNFFYLAPDGTEFFGFQVYHFRQSDASLQGGEISFELNPSSSPFEIEGSYSFIQAEKENGDYLPFIPANKIMSGIKWHFLSEGRLVRPAFQVNGLYAFDQNHPAEFETRTDEYFILNCGASAQWNQITFSIHANNLLNKTYYDHLSRYKYYGIYNMGRSIVLNVNLKL